MNLKVCRPIFPITLKYLHIFQTEDVSTEMLCFKNGIHFPQVDLLGWIQV